MWTQRDGNNIYASVAAEGSGGCKAASRGRHTLERGGERTYTDFKTGEPLLRAFGTSHEAHPAPVAQLWAVGRAWIVPAARDLPNATVVEDLENAQLALSERCGGTDSGR